jgi:mannose-6-phosphate isomerase-like protein (cupin superfamily)
MEYHRHVTATGPDGRSYYAVSEEIAPVQVDFQPGMTFRMIWGTPSAGADIGSITEPDFASFFPVGHGTRAMVIRFPPNDGSTPDFVMGDDPAVRGALRADADSKLPGLFSAHESDDHDPGFHATETIDYVMVLEGHLELELDNGEVVQCSPGHCVVQRGTNHRWRNVAPEPAAFLVVLISAERPR